MEFVKGHFCYFRRFVVVFGILWYAQLSIVFGQKLQRKQFVTLHKWTNLKMTFPTDADFNIAIKNGYYERNKPLPVDVDIEYGDDGYHRTFITIPRLTLGIPYSLATVVDSDNATLLNAKVAPYPNYSWHNGHGHNCTIITSAIRTFIDECWRLWIVDSGQINSIQHCPPQILAFDLINDKLLHHYVMPANLYTPSVSVFTALTVDVGEAEPRVECRDTMVYIADPWGYGLIVYDALKRLSWRIQHKSMRPDANLVNLDSANSGIFTVSLTPKSINNDRPSDRKLYFHALNSYREVGIRLQHVNNRTIWMHNQLKSKSSSLDKYFETIGSRGTQCESEIMDSNGNLYCSLISANAIISWDSSKSSSSYNSDNLKVVAYNPEQLRFVTGLKINRNSFDEDELWALSNEPQLFIGGSLKPDLVKFQIMGCRTKNLQANTPCSVGLKHFSVSRTKQSNN